MPAWTSSIHLHTKEWEFSSILCKSPQSTLDCSQIHGKRIPVNSSAVIKGVSAGNKQENIRIRAENRLFWQALFIYTGVTAGGIFSIFITGNFLDSYIEGSGLTPFKIIRDAEKN